MWGSPGYRKINFDEAAMREIGASLSMDDLNFEFFSPSKFVSNSEVNTSVDVLFFDGFDGLIG